MLLIVLDLRVISHATISNIAIMPALKTDGELPERNMKKIIKKMLNILEYLLPTSFKNIIFEMEITKATLEPETASK